MKAGLEILGHQADVSQSDAGTRLASKRSPGDSRLRSRRGPRLAREPRASAGRRSVEWFAMHGRRWPTGATPPTATRPASQRRWDAITATAVKLDAGHRGPPEEGGRGRREEPGALARDARWRAEAGRGYVEEARVCRRSGERTRAHPQRRREGHCQDTCRTPRGSSRTWSRRSRASSVSDAPMATSVATLAREVAEKDMQRVELCDQRARGEGPVAEGPAAARCQPQGERVRGSRRRAAGDRGRCVRLDGSSDRHGGWPRAQQQEGRLADPRRGRHGAHCDRGPATGAASRCPRSVPRCS